MSALYWGRSYRAKRPCGASGEPARNNRFHKRLRYESTGRARIDGGKSSHQD
jgi:hypothetical protein